MSGTILVKSPVIPQWADFSVTAPSGLVPWPAFYDGSETVTVIWWISTWSNWISYTESNLRLGIWAFTWSREYCSWIYDNGTTLLWVTILSSPWPSETAIIQELTKSTNVVLMKNWLWSLPNYTWLDSIYFEAWDIVVNYTVSWPADRHIRYTIATDSRWLTQVWFDTTGALLSSSIAYQWETWSFFLLYNNAAPQYTLTWFELS